MLNTMVAILRKAADLMSDRLFKMGALMSMEVGKNRLEALGDVEETADLTQSDSWSNMIGDVRGEDANMDLVSTNAAGAGMYRVMVKLPGSP